MQHTRMDGRNDPSFLTATDMGASFNSASEDLLNHRFVSITATWATANSPVGTLTVQGCDDDTNFQNITGASQAVPGTGAHVFEIEVASRYVRLAYTRTSGGSGDDMTASLTVKG